MMDRICEVCEVHPIPWLERENGLKVSTKQYMDRTYCDDECYMTLKNWRRWIKYYADWAKEIENKISKKKIDSWLYAPKMLVGAKHDPRWNE